MMKREQMLFVIHKCPPLKIINDIPSVADFVSNWEPPAGKMQYFIRTAEHCTIPVPSLLLGLKC